MDLFMLRHGIASGRSVSSTAHDADRPLTKKGAKRARIIAERLKDLDISFDVILSSPFKRAKETANIVVGVFKHKDRLNISPHLKVGGSKIALIKEINTRYGSHFGSPIGNE